MHDYSRNERSFVSLGFLSHQDYYFVKGILKQVKEREQQKNCQEKAIRRVWATIARDKKIDAFFSLTLHELRRQNFSLEYLYNIMHICDESKYG